MDSIFKRRSIRKYLQRDVSDDLIYNIIKAGMNAPSARNLKPCEFVVVKDRVIINKIIKSNPNASMLNDAPVAIFVCGRELSEFWFEDMAAATENMLISATELGLGSCWVGIVPKEDKECEIREILNAPIDVRIFSMVALGYAAEEKDYNNYDSII